MYQNRQDNDPPIEKLSTRPRTVRHRSKPTKSLRPARAILTGWKRIVRHTDNRITRVSPMLLRENPVSSSSSSIHLPPLPFAKEERAESRRIHHEEGSQRRGTTRTRPDRTRRLSYPPCTAATAVFQPLRWCVIAWRKPWLQPAAGAPCITSDPSREETSVSAACIVIEWYNKGRAKPVGNGRNGTTWRAFGLPHSPEEEDEEEEEGESAG